MVLESVLLTTLLFIREGISNLNTRNGQIGIDIPLITFNNFFNTILDYSNGSFRS